MVRKKSSKASKSAPIIFGDQSLSDLTLVVDSQEIVAHKLILANHSDVFKAMFYGNFKESKENRVEIKEVSAENFRRFLEIIYTGKISDTSKFLEFPFGGNNHHVNLQFKSNSQTIAQHRQYFHNFWNDTTKLLNIADRFNVTPIVKDYFESVTITAMRLLLNGMDVSKCEKKYTIVHYKGWLDYADQKPFPDIPNNVTKMLFKHFGQ